MERDGRMRIPDDILSEALSLRTAANASRIFELIAARLAAQGATHTLITGLPMPGRPVEPLILHLRWPDRRAAGEPLIAIPKGDALLERCRSAPRGFVIDGITLRAPSDLTASATADAAIRIIASPIRVIPYYQAAVIGAGTAAAMNDIELMAFDYLCGQAFRRLRSLGALPDQRPGDLSARERRVIQLTAAGNTAQEIAEVLSISQRTVHAHLQNAGDKLLATNKTQTVVEAIRFGQIALAD